MASMKQTRRGQKALRKTGGLPQLWPAKMTKLLEKVACLQEPVKKGMQAIIHPT